MYPLYQGYAIIWAPLELLAYPLELFTYPLGLKYPWLRIPALDHLAYLVAKGRKLFSFEEVNSVSNFFFTLFLPCVRLFWRRHCSFWKRMRLVYAGWHGIFFVGDESCISLKAICKEEKKECDTHVSAGGLSQDNEPGPGLKINIKRQTAGAQTMFSFKVGYVYTLIISLLLN